MSSSANNGDGGKRRVLCDVETVQVGSLPWSLRNSNSINALLDAKYLVSFLYAFASASENGVEGRYPAEAWLGMELVFHLLLDKIEISIGEYKFPMIGCNDAPALVHRKE
jgi:hypothetical protein